MVALAGLVTACVLGDRIAAADAAVVRVRVQLVVLSTPSGVQMTTDLDSLGASVGHQSQFIPGRTVFLEAWCQTPGPNPISTAVVDLTYETAFFDTTLAQVSLASQWDTLPFVISVDDLLGRVDDLGGTNFGGFGIAPSWAKIGTVALDITSTPPDRVTFCSEFAGGGLTFAIRGEGVAAPGEVTYGCLTVGCVLDSDCDDGNACTDDSCDSVQGCVNAANTLPCGDGVFCNGAEMCEAKVCVAGQPPELDDGVSCTVDTCDEVNDVVVHTPDDAFCNDGLFCTGEETCDLTLDCQPGADPCPDPLTPFCSAESSQCVDCFTSGDVDGNAIVDLQDFGSFPGCVTTAVGPVSPPVYLPACQCFDDDRDGDVDLQDFGAFQANFQTP